MEHLLWYKNEATCFEEALPIGNGHIGAMVYGKTQVERLSLNDDTLWSGKPVKLVPENAPKALREAKQLVWQKKYKEAEKTLEKGFHSIFTQSYLPLGNLYLEFGHEKVENYKRSLDLRTAAAKVSYTSNGVSYEREVFVSVKYNCIAMRISGDHKGMVNVTVSCDTPNVTTGYEKQNDCLLLYGKTLHQDTTQHPQKITGEEGMEFVCGWKADIAGGEKTMCEDCIKITNADSAVIYFTDQTAYAPDYEESGFKSRESITQRVLETLDGCVDYEQIYDEHVTDHASLYDRAGVSLTEEKKDIPTDERLIRFDGSDKGLYELLFQFGRYLMITASRPGTQPTNLQGIWNEHLLPPWNSNYTININTEMNYWPAFSCNLAECFEPFITLAERIHKTGKSTAKEYYNANGFVSHHNTDLWGQTNPVGYQVDGSVRWAFWNMSSGWIACQLFDCYEYTQDQKLLADRLYPVIRDAAVFYLEIVDQNEDGKYMITPSTSPENAYLLDGQTICISETTGMTISILAELLTRLIKCCQILDVDHELAAKAEEVLKHLYPLQITEDGRIMEWYGEKEESEVEHRHVSHLYSLYPGNLITVEETPELAEACKQSLLVRGDGGTGWSLGWKIILWAFLKDGNHVQKLLNTLLTYVQPSGDVIYKHGGIYPNLFDAHPPFQIDGNFAASEGIASMLVQNCPDGIQILPALPDDWEQGSFYGIKAKGDVTVCAKWENSKVTELTLLASRNITVNVVVNGEKKSVELKSEKMTNIAL